MRPVARIAQSVEQGIENPRVRGSIPRPGTNILKTQPYGWVFAFQRSHPPFIIEQVDAVVIHGSYSNHQTVFQSAEADPEFCFSAHRRGQFLSSRS